MNVRQTFRRECRILSSMLTDILDSPVDSALVGVLAGGLVANVRHWDLTLHALAPTRNSLQQYAAQLQLADACLPDMAVGVTVGLGAYGLKKAYDWYVAPRHSPF